MRSTPWIAHQTHKHRSRDEIPQNVRTVIRGLVSGKLPWPLTLWGPPGRGKTCAALSLLDHTETIQQNSSLSQQVWGLFYWTVSDYHRLVIDIQMGRVDGSRADFNRAIQRASLIVIDELDRSGEVTDSRVEAVLDLVDRRESKPLVLISNGSPDMLGRIYGIRLPSRMSLGTIVQVGGNDRRPDAAKQ